MKPIPLYNVIVGQASTMFPEVGWIYCLLNEEEVRHLAEYFKLGIAKCVVGTRTQKLNNLSTIHVYTLDPQKCPKDWNVTNKEQVEKLLREEFFGSAGFRGVGQILLKYGKEVTQLFVAGKFGEGKMVALAKQPSTPSKTAKAKTQRSTSIKKENMAKTNMKPSDAGKIFISHASKDADLATNFVKHYLRDGLEVSMGEVFYTSHAATTIGVGEDFRNTIKQSLKDARIVILLISENFKQSQYCIAEMGAAWVLDKIMIPICIPPFDRVSAGQLLGPLQYIDVNNKLGLTGLRDQLVKKHGVGKIADNSVHWQEALDDFIAKAEKKIAELEAGKK